MVWHGMTSRWFFAFLLGMALPKRQVLRTSGLRRRHRHGWGEEEPSLGKEASRWAALGRNFRLFFHGKMMILVGYEWDMNGGMKCMTHTLELNQLNQELDHKNSIFVDGHQSIFTGICTRHKDFQYGDNVGDRMGACLYAIERSQSHRLWYCGYMMLYVVRILFQWNVSPFPLTSGMGSQVVRHMKPNCTKEGTHPIGSNHEKHRVWRLFVVWTLLKLSIPPRVYVPQWKEAVLATVTRGCWTVQSHCTRFKRTTYEGPNTKQQSAHLKSRKRRLCDAKCPNQLSRQKRPDPHFPVDNRRPKLQALLIQHVAFLSIKVAGVRTAAACMPFVIPKGQYTYVYIYII